MNSRAILSEPVLRELLGAALGIKAGNIRSRGLKRKGAGASFVAEGRRFVLEAKSASDAASVDRAIRQLQAYLRNRKVKAQG